MKNYLFLWGFLFTQLFWGQPHTSRVSTPDPLQLLTVLNKINQNNLSGRSLTTLEKLDSIVAGSANVYEVQHFFYDNEGKQTEYDEISVSGSQIYGYINFYTYNASDLVNVLTSYELIQDIASPREKIEVDYNAQNFITKLSFYVYNQSQWDLTRQFLYQYNNSNQVNMLIVQLYQTNSWINEKKVEISYDTNGNIIERIFSNWDVSQWVLDEKITNTYVNGLKNQTEDFEWDGTQWMIDEKTTYSYNAQQLPVEEIYYEQDNGLLVETEKTIYQYNAQNALSDVISQEFDNGNWINNNKITYNYDISVPRNALLLPYISFYWLPQAYFMEDLDYERFFTYKLTDGIFYSWDGTQNNWVNQDDFTVYYSNITLTGVNSQEKIKLTVYPNPAHDFIHVSADKKVAKIRLYDLSGRMVLTSSKNKIAVGRLNKGYYLLQVTFEDDTVQTQKIILK